MNPSPEKIQELIRAAHIIAFEGYHRTTDNPYRDEEMNHLLKTIIYLLSKAITGKVEEIKE